MSQTLSLYRLQQIDSQIDRARLRLAAIQQILSSDEQLKLASDKSTTADSGLKAAQLALNQAETDVSKQRIKIEQIESSLYSRTSHTPKELQDLQNDDAALKRHLLQLEDRQLEAMLALEQAEAGQKNASVELEHAQTQGASRNQTLLEEHKSLLLESDRLATERSAAVVNIPPSDLGLYDSLRQQRRGVAVAAIQENSCGACGAFLTAAQIQSARSASQVSLCPSCGRILYCS